MADDSNNSIPWETNDESEPAPSHSGLMGSEFQEQPPPPGGPALSFLRTVSAPVPPLAETFGAQLRKEIPAGVSAPVAPPPEPLDELTLPELFPDEEESLDTFDELAASHSYQADDYDATDEEPFDRADAHKMGILGGKGVGKSYLFQSMVYRTYSGQQSGALTYYLERDAMHLFMAAGEHSNAHTLTRTGAARSLNRVNFIKKYQTWQRLPFTSKSAQHWYRLRLPFRTGWFGEKRTAMDVEFFDGSGEGFFELPTVSSEDRALWQRAYVDARVMVFCLPLWAAFPGASLSDEDWEKREFVLEGFEQVIQNYKDMRARLGQASKPVSSILALTMSDDRRGALKTLRDRWISPYLDSPNTYLKQLRTGRGVARYLANARIVSEAMHEEFSSARDPRISDIPQSLDFDRGRPWVIPLSAMEGERLEELEHKYVDPDDPERLREARKAAPTPVHVELPLLVALCERENALM